MFAPNRRHTWQPEASCARDYQDLACSGGGSSDSLLEGTGFEPSVPPKKRRSSREAPRPTIVVSRDDLCLMTPSSLSVRHLSSATAERPFTRAGPMVRIRFPPAGSLQTFGLSLRARGSEPQHADPSQAIGARKSGDNQLHRFRVLNVRIRSAPAASLRTIGSAMPGRTFVRERYQLGTRTLSQGNAKMITVDDAGGVLQNLTAAPDITARYCLPPIA